MKIDISIPEELAKALDEYKASGRSPDVLVSKLLAAYFTGGSYEPDVSQVDSGILLDILQTDLERIKDQLSRIMKECADLGIEIRGRS
ncbi:hypothetical protein FTO68_06200 [Methanocalculus taiwanensis]|uniref:CopG family transcriptional regulator n=1 Tax=Methanocalculus taiwanensis TaxID=106207 RepID=A0ABD4TIP9_9EURY|nr:hypothetical protein [Methanocalculus taiwanensis]MCQ1538576.1 hypothetical protein [Methanocalculus taiwanensis]